MKPRIAIALLTLLLAGSLLVNLRQARRDGPPAAAPVPPAAMPKLAIPEMDFSGTGLSDRSWQLGGPALPSGPGWVPPPLPELAVPALTPEAPEQ